MNEELKKRVHALLCTRKDLSIENSWDAENYEFEIILLAIMQINAHIGEIAKQVGYNHRNLSDACARIERIEDYLQPKEEIEDVIR